MGRRKKIKVIEQLHNTKFKVRFEGEVFAEIDGFGAISLYRSGISFTKPAREKVHELMTLAYSTKIL